MNSELSQIKEKADNLFNETNYGEAIELYCSILEYEEGLDEKERGSLNQLVGRCHSYNTNYSEAKWYFLESYKTRKTILGEEDPYTLISAEWLGSVYSNLKEWQEAKELFLEILSIKRRILDEDDPAIFHTIIGLVKINGAFDVFEEQKELLLEAVALGDKIFGVNADKALDAKFRLTELYYDNSSYEDAISLLKRMHADYTEEYEEDDTTLKICRLLGDNYYYIEGKHKETEYYYREAIRIHEEFYDETDEELVKIYYDLGFTLLFKAQNYLEAEKAYEFVIDNCDEFLAQDSWRRELRKLGK